VASLKALGGTSDILPEETKRWQTLEQSAHRLFDLYGYQEIRTPLIEEAGVFTRSLGEAAEIVTKQMYLFQDRGGRQVALRPEATASVVRAFIEHGLDKTSGVTRLYYLGPMFRAERPQAGRRRQFHQMGVEVLGSNSPYQDAEVMALLMHLLRDVGVAVARQAGEPGAILQVNNLGCLQDRAKMLEALKSHFTRHQTELCPDCKERLKVNPLRILDCKQEKCRSVAQGSTVPSEWLCAACKKHFENVLQALKALHVSYELNLHLVRGLDYYTKTAFEVIHLSLGAQNALGGGGRYDDLVEALGGTPTPAVGFAVGVERILMVLKAQVETAGNTPVPPRVFVAALGQDSLREGFGILTKLRAAGVSSVTDYEARPLKRQLEQANKLGCGLVLIFGDVERDKRMVTLKDMASGEQTQVPKEQCIEWIQRRLELVP